MPRIYTEIRIHHKTTDEKEQFEKQLDDKVKASGFSSRAEYIRVMALKSNILIKKEDLKMKKVKIHGYSINEGYRVFEILDREELEAKIEELWSFEIYKQTFEKAYGYTFSGTAYTYIDARDGEVKTYWTQDNTFQHPFDSFYEIVLCRIDTPLDFDIRDFFENEEEEERYKESKLSLEEFFGEDEYQYRLENIFDYWANEFEFDWQKINEQLDGLYSKIHEE